MVQRAGGSDWRANTMQRKHQPIVVFLKFFIIFIFSCVNSLTALLWGQNCVILVGRPSLLPCEWEAQWLIHESHLLFGCGCLYSQVLIGWDIYLACGSEPMQLPYLTTNLYCVWLVGANLLFPDPLFLRLSVVSSTLPFPWGSLSMWCFWMRA